MARTQSVPLENQAAFISKFYRIDCVPEQVTVFDGKCLRVSSALEKADHNLKKVKLFRYKPGDAAIREIRRYQATTELLVKRLPFAHLVQELVTAIEPTPSMHASTVEALQTSVETHVV
jgi:histone H3